MPRKIKTVGIDADIGEKLAKIAYDHRTPMVSLVSDILRDAMELLDMGALPDPNNLTEEGMRTWEDLKYEATRKPGRRKRKMVEVEIVEDGDE